MIIIIWEDTNLIFFLNYPYQYIQIILISIIEKNKQFKNSSIGDQVFYFKETIDIDLSTI